VINAFVHVRADADAIADLAPRLAEIDGVRESHSVAGSDTDIVVIVTVASHEDIARVVTEHISREPGVQSTITMIAFRSFSPTDVSDAFGDFD
jgi:DNA-binding Lrp family transcriptional regulator